MASQHETLLRHWLMLRAIPRYPAKVTATQLKERLDGEDFSVTKRTIERDLMDLSAIFPLALDNRSKPYGWSWQKNAPAFDLPGISNNEALTLMLVEQHLKQFMPASTQDGMAPYFKAARNKLDTLPKSKQMGSWLNKVRSVPPTQPLIPPAINLTIQDCVTEALLQDKQMTIRYQGRSKAPAEHRVHPLALVQRGPITYLYVRFNDYQNTRTLAMHRITEATVLEDAAQYPKGFNIDDEIVRGRFGFGEGQQFKLKAKFTSEAGEHLYETPLSKDQKIEVQKDSKLLVTATVADTPQLIWWLLAFGAGVEVVGPAGLRRKVVGVLNEAAGVYGK